MTKKELLCSQCKQHLDSSYDWLINMPLTIRGGIICQQCSNENRSNRRTARILKEEKLNKEVKK